MNAQADRHAGVLWIVSRILDGCARAAAGVPSTQPFYYPFA